MNDSSNYRDLFDSVDLSQMKLQILGDLVQSLISVNAISHEDEEVSTTDALISIQNITQNALWLIFEGYRSLFWGKLTREEIQDVLERKYECLIFEKENAMFDLYVNLWYRNFERKKKIFIKDVK
ncbi:hypothetical protein [Metabacillus sp. Hm71]|uniref:hypothetical protein n=1 Tax=Metabacillus sp. Hm71 TaxID=3450743 RepID=UPI003F423B12